MGALEKIQSELERQTRLYELMYDLMKDWQHTDKQHHEAETSTLESVKKVIEK